MVAKLTGFALTGSGAMLAEGIHSIADVGNQSLLAIGMNRAAKPPDDEYPEGYTRDAFIWALISAVGIFFLGCGVTVAHGVESLLSTGHHGVEGAQLSIGILIFSLVIEGLSLGIAVRELKRAADEEGKGLMDHIRTTDDPFGVAVLYEDGAAVLGVIIALIAVILSYTTGEHYWDALGSIAVGALLGLLAVNLVQRNRALLIGKAVNADVRDKLREVLENDPAVESVAISRAIVDGSDSYRISAEIDFDGHYVAEQYLVDKDLVEIHGTLDNPEKLKVFLGDFGEAVMSQIGSEIDRIEKHLIEQVPKAKHIALEPD